MKLEIKQNTGYLCLGPKDVVCLGQEEMILVASY